MRSTGRFFIVGLGLILTGGVPLARQPGVPAFQQAAVPTGTPIATGPARIMFINFSQVLTDTDEARQEMGKIQAFVEQKNRENETRTQELQQRQQQFQEQQRALNPQTLAEMQREIAKLEKNLQRYREDTAAEIEARRNMLFGALGQKIQTILDGTAKQNGYSAILYWDSLMQNNLGGYFDPAYDITAEIIARYNTRYPVAAAGTSSGQ